MLNIHVHAHVHTVRAYSTCSKMMVELFCAGPSHENKCMYSVHVCYMGMTVNDIIVRSVNVTIAFVVLLLYTC